MDEVEKNLAQAVEINALIRKLRQSLELFEEGRETSAIEKIASVEEGIEELSDEDLSEGEEMEEKLSIARENLKWVEDNCKGSE